MQKELARFLSQFISEHKLSRFEEVLQYRTRYLTVVLEDIFQPQNASAVLRTNECLGIQDTHIIEDKNRYALNPDVVVGSSKWIRLYKYRKAENNTLDCLQKLKAQGYRIVATSPHRDNYTPDTLPLDQKTALLFGTEGDGLSDTALAQADAFVKIPMFGFTESYNISVSAAIVLSTLVRRMHEGNYAWQLHEEEQDELRLQWMKKVVKRYDLLEAEFYTKHSGKK